VSSWKGSNLNHAARNVKLIESRPPLFDPDNRRKQFLSTWAGIQALERDVTHILKIRTDQPIPPDLLLWLKKLFKNDSKSETSVGVAPGKLVISEFLPTVKHYVGDFVFAGHRDTVEKFVSANLEFGLRNMHPSIGTDYVLKYLSKVEPEFNQQSPFNNL